MKLVIDSNIFVSSLDPKDIFHAECYPILEKILTFEIEALCPSLVLVEVTCVLRRNKFRGNCSCYLQKFIPNTCYQLVGYNS